VPWRDPAPSGFYRLIRVASLTFIRPFPNFRRMSIDFSDFRSPAATPAGTAPADPSPQTGDACDVCGASALEWRKCKLVCLQCRSIVKSCADL
jgi:hypothetical protein